MKVDLREKILKKYTNAFSIGFFMFEIMGKSACKPV